MLFQGRLLGPPELDVGGAPPACPCGHGTSLGSGGNEAGAVPVRYRSDVAMNLRLSDVEAEALRRKAQQDGRSMQEVARAAIAEYVSERPQRLRTAVERVRLEDAELLARLGR